MAKGDVKVIDPLGKINYPVWKFPTRAGTTAINAGEPVVTAVSADERVFYVVALADGQPLTTTDYLVGVSASASSHTTSADGFIDVYLAENVVFGAKAKSTTQFDTQAEVNSAVNYRIPFDLTGSTYTADLANADTAGLQVIGGDPDTQTVYFVTRDGASWKR